MPLAEVRIELQVNKGNVPLEHVTVLSLTRLRKGQGSTSHTYVPEEGWQRGAEYTFRMALYTAGRLYTITTKETLRL